MSTLLQLVKIGATSRQMRLFLHQHKLTHLRMDAQSLLNLKMRVLRASRQGRLHDTVEEELVGESNLDDIGHLFATVYSAASESHDPESFNLFVEAVSNSKIQLKVRPEFCPQLVQLKAKWQGFDYRIPTNSTNQLTAACWITIRQKERFKDFGDVIFLDFVEGTNAEKFSACLAMLPEQRETDLSSCIRCR